ncbi:MAG: AMP-binding protein [Acidimicrobiia bacterium]|nr:AMP-binding protein [Acidimicrobiia bacterium]
MTMTEERPTAPQAPMPSVSSLPARLRQIAHESPTKIALREKVFGIWEETSYAEYWDLVKVIGMALRALGVKPGDKVAVHSENRKAWVLVDLAAQAIQATSVGLYPTNPAPEVHYLLDHSDARVLIAEDQEQVDKALEVASRLPNLEKIVYLEPRGVRSYDDPILMAWEEMISLGRQELTADSDRIDGLVDDVDPESVATLVYTSGTTGPPKGAMLTHRNLAWVMDHVTDAIADEVPAHVEILSYLPLCHVAEKLYTLILALKTEAVVNFAESIDTVTADLREVQPTYFLGVPRIWEKMHAGVMIRMQDASRLKRLVFALALSSGMKNADRIIATGKRGIWGDITYGIFWVASYRSLKDKLGMRSCVGALSGAAPIAPEVLKFFMALGVPIYEGYGMTENTAYATANREGHLKLGTVGIPNPYCEVRLLDDGEILTRHPGVFKGYYKNPESTAETLSSDGWLHTGDVGEWDGEHLRIVDRKKHIIITAGGKNISPSEIENKLKVSPFIKEAVVLGDRRKFIAALIGIEYDTVANWALRREITFTTYRDLSEKPEVVDLIKKQVSEANEHFASVAQVKQVRLIPKELDHEDGELTATQKVKRSKIEDMFGDLIQDIYGG